MENDLDNGLDVIKLDDRNLCARQRLVPGNSNDRRVIRIEGRLVDGCAIDFDLGMAPALVAFHQDEIDGLNFLTNAASSGSASPRSS